MNQREVLLRRLGELRPRMQRMFSRNIPVDLREELGGVTLHQLEVLRHLADADGGALTMRELATSLGVGASAATQMVDRLIREGLVERVADTEDRRVVWVRPTARSATMIGRFQAVQAATERRLLEPLDDAALSQYVALTALIVDGEDAAATGVVSKEGTA